MNDRSTLDPERRQTLVKTISAHYAKYQQSTYTLKVFVKETREALETNRAIHAELMNASNRTTTEDNKVTDGISGGITPEGVNNILHAIRSVTSGEVRTADTGGFRLELVDNTVKLTMDLTPHNFLVTMLVGRKEIYDLRASIPREMALIYSCALFDGLISDIIMSLLTQIPEQLKSGRKISYEDVLKFDTRDELMRELARREMLDVTRSGALSQLEYFKQKHKVDVLEAGLLTSNAILKAFEQRHLLVHNNGIVSPDYYNKFPDDCSIGQRLQLDDNTLGAHLILLEHLGLTLMEKLMAKYVEPLHVEQDRK